MVSTAQPRALDAASRVAGAAILKASAIWSGLWLVGLSFAVITGSASFRSMTVAVVCLAATWLAWGASLVAKIAPAPIFAGTAVFTALAIEVNTEPKSIGDPYSALVLWLNLAALVCGFLLAARVARWVIGSMCAVSLLLGLAVTAGTVAAPDDPSWRALVAIQAYSLVIGMATIGGMQAIRHAAAHADEATSVRVEAQGTEAREAAMRAESFRIARALHDGPLNTLAALRIGSIDPESLRERCAADQRSIDQLLGSQPSTGAGQQTALARVVAVASERARLLGLRLRVDAAQGPDQQPVDAAVPAAVESAICGAVAEALLNVSKHSGSREAELSIVTEPSGMTATVTDRGVGFDRSRQLAPLSIVKRCEQVGVRAAVTSRPQRGTTVAVSWQRPSGTGPAAAAITDSGSNVMVLLARQVSAWFVALFAVLSLLDFGFGTALITAIALIAVASIALGAAYRRRSTPPPIWFRWVLTLAAGFLIWLPGSTWSGVAQLGLWWWGAEAGMLLVLLMVFLVGRPVWIALSYVSFMIGMGLVALRGSTGAVPEEGLSISVTVALIDSGAIYGAWRLRQLVIWFTATATRGQADAVAARTRLVAAAERDRVRQVWARSMLSSTRDFMAGLAAGGRSATDPEVLAECEREEALLRAVVSIDAAWGELGQALIALVGWANELKIRAQVRAVSVVALPTPEQAIEIEAALQVELALAAEGSTVVFTVGSASRTGGSLITVLDLDERSAIPRAGEMNGCVPDSLEQLARAGVATSRVVEGDQLLIQMKWDAPARP